MDKRIKVCSLVVLVYGLNVIPVLQAQALPSWNEPALGPLGGRNVYMPHLAWFSFPADHAFALPHKALVSRSALYYLNEFGAYPSTTGVNAPRYGEDGKLLPESQVDLTAMDYESTIFELGADWQFHEMIRICVDWRLHFLYGGFLDSFIEGLHQTFNLSNAGRHYFDQNQVRWNIISKSGFNYSAEGKQIAAGDLDLRSVLTLIQRHSFAMAVGAAFKIPVGDRNLGFGSGYPDIALEVLLDWSPWKRWLFYGNIGLVFPFGGMANIIVQIIPAVEFRVSRAISLVMQMHFQTAAISNSMILNHDNFGNVEVFSLMQTDIKVGIKGRHGRFEWQFYFEEDPITWEGPDIVFFFGVGYNFSSKP